MITENQKTEIQSLLNKFCEGYNSQAQAVNALQNVSEASVINIRKNKWEGITDAMWLKVGRQVGYNPKGSWEIVPTQYFNTLTSLLDDAKDYSNVMAVCSPSGSGKTLTAATFKANNQNVYHIVCAEFMNKKNFLGRILSALGKDTSGNISEMMEAITETLLSQEAPLIILDEADKLNDNVLYFFITLYNELQNRCGMVMLATDFLGKRLLGGVRKNKKGYNEIWSRLGRKCIQIKGTSFEEVSLICQKNGLNNPTEISRTFNEFEGDLRRVERVVHKYKKRAA